MTLPASFLTRPITHRGLHNLAEGRAENSVKAFKAAIAGGYGIELDLQLSRDGQAMVFHDYGLDRLAEASGPIAQRDAAELGEIPLKGDGDGIPTLPEVLELVAGKVPLLIEIKDQDGGMGPKVGPLERATVEALKGYKGDVAVMSFNPHSVAAVHDLAPDLCHGLTTCDFNAEDWPTVKAARRAELATLEDVNRLGAQFISHDRADLNNPRVTALKAAGLPILCWTVKSPEHEAAARKVADNITFEQYLA